MAGERTVAIGGNSGAELKETILRIENLLEQKAAVGEDIKDLYTIAKTKGFDPKIMRIIIRRRAMERSVRDEQDAMIETYENAVE